jgi:hypothetical protein
MNVLLQSRQKLIFARAFHASRALRQKQQQQQQQQQYRQPRSDDFTTLDSPTKSTLAADDEGVTSRRMLVDQMTAPRMLIDRALTGGGARQLPVAAVGAALNQIVVAVKHGSLLFARIQSQLTATKFLTSTVPMDDSGDRLSKDLSIHVSNVCYVLPRYNNCKHAIYFN